MRARSRTTPFVCSCCKISASRCNVANNFPSLSGTQLRIADCGLRICGCEDRMRVPLSDRSEKYHRVREQVGFIEHEDHAFALGTPRANPQSAIRNPQFVLYDLHLLFPIRMARIDHVQDEVRLLRLFDRGAERGDEVMRQLTNEADGVGHAKAVAFTDVHLARECVESREQAILDEHIRA